MALPLCAQVKFAQTSEKIDIEINGKTFSTFVIGGEAPKPYLAPMRTADGVVIARRFPMEKVEKRGIMHITVGCGSRMGTSTGLTTG